MILSYFIRNYHKIKALLILGVLSTGLVSATPSCQIVTENFSSLTDGTTVDNGSTGWYLDASQIPDALYFAVKSHRFQAEELGGQGIWYSKVMNVTGYPNFQIGVKITAEGNLTSSEYVKIYYKLNGGTETLLDQRTGNFGTIDFQSPLLNANTVQIIVKLYNYDKGTYDKSIYYIEQYRIFSNVNSCSLQVNPSASGSITCANSSVTLSPGTNTTTNVTYQWTGPNGFTSTAQNPVVTTAGTYNVTASIAASASTATSSVAVTQNTATPGAGASVSGTLECSSPSVVITGTSPTSGVSYSWSGPDDFSSDLAVDTIHAAGTYTVTVTDPVNGCTSISAVTVAQGTEAPGAIASANGSLTCTSTSVILSGSSGTSGVTYNWSGPDNFTSSLQNPTVTGAGTYSLTVTDSTTGCTSTDTANVIQNGNLPGASANVSGPITCKVNSVTLTGNSSTSNVTYNWNGPGNFISTIQNPVVNETGIYTLTVTNSSTGCQSTASVSVTRDTISPGAVASASGSLNCTSTSVTLSGGSGVSGVTYSWSGSDGFTATTQNPSVSVPGNYSLTVTNPVNGCTSMAAITVVQSEIPPGATAGASGTLTCLVTSSTLLGNSLASGVTYSWSGPDNFISTLQNPTVNTAGTYTLTVTDPSNGCQSIATATVDQNTTPPEVAASVSGTLTCDAAVTLLGNSSTSGVTFGWTGPNDYISNLQNPSVSISGTYNLTVTDPSSGCTNSQSVEVAASTATTADFWVEDFTLANGTTSDNGPTSWSSSTSGSGTFSVQNNEFKASFNSGNTAEGVWTSGIIDISSESNVVISTGLRSETASTSDNFETNDYINVYYKLNGGPETLIYGDVAGLGSTTNTTATATATSQPLNGSTLQIVIRLKNSDPTERYYFDNVKLTGTPVTTGIDANASVSDILTCDNSSVTLQGSSTASGVSYSWTGPGGFTSTLQNPPVTNPGSYVLTVSSSTGCTASAIVNVDQDIAAPDVTAGVSGDITCTSPSVTLSGSSSVSGATYNWSGPNSFTSTAQNLSVNQAGSYTLTVTNPANGCISSQSIEVTSTAGTTSTVWLEDFDLSDGTTVDNGSTAWTRTYTGTKGSSKVQSGAFVFNYLMVESIWKSQVIDISSLSKVTASIDIKGEGTLNINEDYFRAYYILNGGSEIPFVSYNQDGAFAYTTSTTPELQGNTLQIVVRAYNTYSDETYRFDNVKITGTNQLTANASANGVLGCSGTPVTLSGSSNIAGVTYSWSGPGNFSSSLPNPSVTTQGIYTLTVTNPENGCVANDTTDVMQNISEPGISAIVSGPLTCTISSVTLSGSSPTSGVAYSWTGPGGFTSTSQNPSVNDTGTYSLLVTNPVNACTSLATVTVTRDTIAPEAIATVSGALTCTNSQVTLSGSSDTPGVTYSWTGPDNFSSSLQNPQVNVPGTYVLTVTDPATGCTGSKSIEVFSNTGATGTVWLEDFPHTNGTTVDNGITGWSVQSTTGTFSVCNNEFKVTNTGTSAQGVWTSGTIDISGKTNVSVSVDVRSAVTGDAVMNTNGTYIDYIRFYYKLDGGSKVLFAEKSGSINNNSIYGTSVLAGPLNGTTLQIIIKARASGSDEFYYFDNVNVTGNGQIDASATVNGSLTCSDTIVTLIGNSGVPGVTYNWSGPGNFTSSLRETEVSTPGTYSLTVTDPSNGCYSVVTTDVEQNTALPGASAGVSGQLSCNNVSVTLQGNSSTPDVDYNWSGPGGFTSTQQNPSVNTPGTYMLTVTNTVNGCASTVSADVTAAPATPASVFWLEDFTLADGTTSDAGTTAWSSSTSGSGTFSVQNNEFKASFNSGNTAEGVWTSSVIDISAKSNVVISADLRSETASTGDNFETNDYINVYYKLDGGPEILIYGDEAGLGSTTNTTATATVTSQSLNGNTLQVVIRMKNSDPTERYYVDNVELTGSDQTVGTITTSVSGNITCPNPNVQLSASVNNTSAAYYWIAPDNSIINQQNPTVNQPGNYTAVVTVGGCQASKTVQVLGSKQSPDISVSGDHLTCSTDVPAILNAVSSDTNLAYSWSGPAGFSSDVKNPFVLNAGTYTVTVTDQANLCTNTASFDVQFGTLIWNEGFDGLIDGTIEDMGSTAWSIDISQIHTVDLSSYSSESGVPYYFEVRNNELAAKSTRGEVVWTSYPIDISGVDQPFARLDVSGEGTLNDSTNCGKDCWDYDYIQVSYKVDGGAEIPFENFGSIPGRLTLPGIKVSSNIPDGDLLQIIIRAYNTGNDEIFHFDNIQVLALGQGGGPVTASASGPITCDSNEVTLTASPNIAGNDYNWTGPGGFTSNQPNVNVGQPGTYTLIVTGNTGCVTSDTVNIEVMQNTVPPDISIDSAGMLTCADTTVQITGNSSAQGTAYSWEGPGGFSADLQNVMVTLPGKYVLMVKDTINGCISTDSINIDQDTTLPDLALSPADTLTCATISTSLNASTTTQNTILKWSGFGTGENPVSVMSPGTYTVTATNNTNGCIKHDSVTVVRNISMPGVTGFVNDTLTCKVTSVVLSANSPTPGVYFNWTGPDNFNSSGQYPSTTTSGSYTVTAINPSNGCSSSDSITVAQDKLAPLGVVASVPDSLTCSVTSVMLTGTSTTGNVLYGWTGPNGYTSTDQNPLVSMPGEYILTVTNPVNGCFTADNVSVRIDTVAPADVSSTVSGTINCKYSSVILSGTSTTSGVSYSWNGPDGFTSVLQNPVITAGGRYYLTVTNTVNGCMAEDSTDIVPDTTGPSDVTAEVLGNLNCSNSYVFLNGSSTTGNVSYYWTGPNGFEATDAITFAASEGDYTLYITNPVNGCIDSATVAVEGDFTEPVCDIIDPDTSPVALSNDTISAQTISDGTYSWSLSSSNENWIIVSGADSQELIFQAGDEGTNATASLVVTNNGNGCYSTCQIGLTTVSTLKSTSVIASDTRILEKDIQVKVYPNPFRDKAYIEFTPLEDIRITVEIYSANGELQGKLFDGMTIASQQYRIVVDGTKLLSGTYYFIIKTSKWIYSDKLILIR